jgi:hypothetical protein
VLLCAPGSALAGAAARSQDDSGLGQNPMHESVRTPEGSGECADARTFRISLDKVFGEGLPFSADDPLTLCPALAITSARSSNSTSAACHYFRSFR